MCYKTMWGICTVDYRCRSDTEEVGTILTSTCWELTEKIRTWRNWSSSLTSTSGAWTLSLFPKRRPSESTRSTPWIRWWTASWSRRLLGKGSLRTNTPTSSDARSTHEIRTNPVSPAIRSCRKIRCAELRHGCWNLLTWARWNSACLHPLCVRIPTVPGWFRCIICPSLMDDLGHLIENYLNIRNNNDRSLFKRRINEDEELIIESCASIDLTRNFYFI